MKNLIILPTLLFTTFTANADVSYVSVTDPESVKAVYQHTDGALNSLYAEYDDETDVFSFRYDFTSSSKVQLGDAYIKFTNDGLLPNGNNGTNRIPTYHIDGDNNTLLISNGVNSYTGYVDYEYDSVTREASIAFEHSVSEVFDALKVDPDVANWSGGSFSSNFGLWSHVVNVDFYTLNAAGGLNINPLTAEWIAFDPKANALTTHTETTVDVPEPSVLLLLMSGLGFMAVRRRK